MWETALAVVLALIVGGCLPAAVYDKATAEIVTVLGFLIAAFVPAMVLSASVLRAGNLSVKSVRSFGQALDRQITVFGGLFIYAVVASVIVVLGSLASWTLPHIPTGLQSWPTINLSPVFSMLLTFTLAFVLFRSVAFVAGVRSILRLAVMLAEHEAQSRDRDRDAKSADELATYRMPEHYGAPIDLPH